MSKRRGSFNEDDDNYTTRALRSIKINRNLSSCSNYNVEQHHEIDSHSLNLIQQIIQHLSQLTGMNLSNKQIKDQANLILQRYPEKEQTLLHYQNQLVEIPISGTFQLMHNENFPYRREPISISTDVDYFLDNIQSFKIFKKVILKNCNLCIINDSFLYYNKCPLCSIELTDINKTHYHNDEMVPLTPSLQFQCQITSHNNNERILECPVTETTLRLSNILLSKPNLWNAAFDIVANSNILDEQKNGILLSCFNNLIDCFQRLTNVDIAVSVNSLEEVTVSNIFHNYFTL